MKVSIVEPGAIETPMREKGNAAANELKAAMNADQLRLYGKAIEGWVNRDDMGLLQQIGVVPAPGVAVSQPPLSAARPNAKSDAVTLSSDSRSPRTTGRSIAQTMQSVS